MENEIYRQLIQYGGATAVIVALIYLFKELRRILETRKNGAPNGTQRILTDVCRRLEKIEKNDLHDLDYLMGKVDIIQRDVGDLKSRVSVVETRLNIKQ